MTQSAAVAATAMIQSVAVPLRRVSIQTPVRTTAGASITYGERTDMFRSVVHRFSVV
jgi:hypothetical protein